MRGLTIFSTAIVVATITTTQAAAQVEIVISEAGKTDSEGMSLVELRLLNGASEPQTIPLADRVEARIGSRTVWLERAAGTPADAVVPAGGFVRARYRMRLPSDTPAGKTLLSIPAWNTQQVAIAAGPASSDAQLAQVDPAAEADPTLPAPAPSDRTAGNAFLANLSAYEPIYAVYGPGTNSDARIQISFKYQLFGSRQADGLPLSWRDGLHFAYTQRMFWDLGADSSPFRNIDFQPEIFYLTPSATLSGGAAADSISISAQAGLRHESNGRDGPDSRSFNTIYVAPMAAIPLGDGYRLSVSPRFSLFVGDKSDNPDIRRYRGNSALFLEIGKDEGLRLSTFTRFNFSSGKGSLGVDLSYPLSSLVDGGPDFYLFGQSFVGYGENLLDYDRRTTRFRLGVALVR